MNKRSSNKQEYTIKPMVGIANTDFGLIEKCHEVLNAFGIGHVISNKYRVAQKNNKPQKAVFIVGLKRVQKFIEVFGKNLNKQRQVECLDQFIKHRLSVHRKVPYGSLEDSLFNRLKTLNQKGILNDYTLNTQVMI